MGRPKRTSNVGAALVRFNAVHHGLTSRAPVVPGLESVEEWESFRAALVGCLSAEIERWTREDDE